MGGIPFDNLPYSLLSVLFLVLMRRAHMEAMQNKKQDRQPTDEMYEGDKNSDVFRSIYFASKINY
jgi:hypothetical protein